MQNQKMSGSGKELRFISYMQNIGIMLVVLGHSFHEYPDGIHGKSTLLYQLIYSFHMPLFIFISGFLLNLSIIRRKTVQPVSDFLLKKVKRLIIPFVTLTLVTFIPRSFMSGIADDEIQLTWKMLFASLTDVNHLIIPYFWFIQSIFTLLLIGFFLLLLKEKIGMKDTLFYVLVVAIFGFLPLFFTLETSFFSLNNSCANAIFFFSGMTYARYCKPVDSFIKWSSPMMLILLFSFWVVSFFMFKDSGWMIIVCSMFGIAMTISLSRILENRHIAILDHLNGAYYIIFLLSWYFNVLCQQVLSHFTDFPWWIYSMMSLVSGIYVPLVIYRYIRRHPASHLAVIARRFLGQ